MKKNFLTLTVISLCALLLFAMLSGCGTPQKATDKPLPPPESKPVTTRPPATPATPAPPATPVVHETPETPAETATPETQHTTAPLTPVPDETGKPADDTGHDAGGDIDIMPPDTTTPVEPVKETPEPKETDTGDAVKPPVPMVEFDENFYELTGVMKSGSSNQAMLQKEGKSLTGQVGTKFEDGWAITKIESRSVTLKKGDSERTINLKEAVPPPGGGIKITE